VKSIMNREAKSRSKNLGKIIADLDKGERKVLLILLKHGGNMNASALEKEYQSKYVYAVASELIRKGLIKKEDGNYSLSQEGITAAVKEALRTKEERECIIKKLENIIAPIFKNKFMKQFRENVDMNLIYDSLLESLSEIDELYQDKLITKLNVNYDNIIEDFLKSAIPESYKNKEICNKVILLWIRHLIQKKNPELINQLLEGTLRKLYYHMALYTYSPLKWTLKERLSYLLIKIGATLLWIVLLSIIMGSSKLGG